MSLAPGKHGDVWVLDQVNGRVQHFGADGHVLGEVHAGEATQDLALARNGDLVLVDRIGKSEVTIVDESGNLVDREDVAGGPFHEGGEVTGVFTDDDGVYLEREHTESARIAGGDGVADPARPVVPGRPTRDGSAYLRAAIVHRGDPTVILTVFEPDGSTRWTRAVSFARGIVNLVLLDSDLQGHLFVGAEIAGEAITPPYALIDPTIAVERLALLDGSEAGELSLPAPTLPDEMFRDLVVTDGGDILQMLATGAGVQISSYSFPP